MAGKPIKRRGKATDAEIESKDQRWHCRNRITLVFGSNHIEELETYIYKKNSVEFKTVKFHQAKSKAIEEILDNCIDEFYRGHVTTIDTVLSDDGEEVTVTDNGIGFPLNKISQVYTEFRTGSKFKDNDVDSKGFLHRTLGQNGLGASATCLTADLFKVTVKHYNSKKQQTIEFIDGALKSKKGKAKPFRGASGVSVTVRLSKEVYKNSKIDKDLLRKRIIDLAYNNPGLTFTFNGEKFLFKKGLYELAQKVNPKTALEVGTEEYKYETTVPNKKKKAKGKIDLTLSVCLDPNSDDREKFISFVNSTPTFDGGFHQDRVRRLFINSVKAKLERAAKKEKVSVNDNDVLAGMTFVLGLTMPNPRFESQTKRKLVKDSHLEKILEKFMEKSMKSWIKKNADYLEIIIERAKARSKFQAIKEAAKVGRKQKRQRVEKLLDANERKDRSKCTLFITEGDSAIGGLRSARDKLTQGGIALRGKPMNVAQASINDVLKNQEFSDIMASIGLTLGQEPDFDKMRYRKIVFLADSDVDGGHINTLLTNFFYQYWPQLFDEGCVQIAKAPLFEVVTERGTQYAETPEELEKIKKKFKVKEIMRNKGLGEMSPEAWKYTLNREEFTKIIVEDKKEAKETLDICFGKESSKRKELLIDEGDSKNKSKGKKLSKKTAKKAAKKTAKKAAKKTAKKAAKKSKKKVVKKK